MPAATMRRSRVIAGRDPPSWERRRSRCALSDASAQRRRAAFIADRRRRGARTRYRRVRLPSTGEEGDQAREARSRATRRARARGREPARTGATSARRAEARARAERPAGAEAVARARQAKKISPVSSASLAAAARRVATLQCRGHRRRISRATTRRSSAPPAAATFRRAAHAREAAESSVPSTPPRLTVAASPAGAVDRAELERGGSTFCPTCHRGYPPGVRVCAVGRRRAGADSAGPACLRNRRRARAARSARPAARASREWPSFCGKDGTSARLAQLRRPFFDRLPPIAHLARPCRERKERRPSARVVVGFLARSLFRLAILTIAQAPPGIFGRDDRTPRTGWSLTMPQSQADVFRHDA